MKYCISSPGHVTWKINLSMFTTLYLAFLIYGTLLWAFVSHIFSYLFSHNGKGKCIASADKGSKRVFQSERRGHVLLQIPKTRCAVGPLYCQHVWMPCSINFSLNSLTRIYETCNMGLQLFWSLRTCSTRCRLHFKGRKKKAEIREKLARSILQCKEF